MLSNVFSCWQKAIGIFIFPNTNYGDTKTLNPWMIRRRLYFHNVTFLFEKTRQILMYKGMNIVWIMVTKPRINSRPSDIIINFLFLRINYHLIIKMSPWRTDQGQSGTPDRHTHSPHKHYLKGFQVVIGLLSFEIKKREVAIYTYYSSDVLGQR